MFKWRKLIIYPFICLSIIVGGCSEFNNLFGPTDDEVATPTSSKIEGFGDVGSTAQGNATMFGPSSLANIITEVLLSISSRPLLIFRDHDLDQSMIKFFNSPFSTHIVLDFQSSSSTYSGPTGGPDGTEGWYYLEDQDDGDEIKAWIKYSPTANPNLGEPTNATDVWKAVLINRADGEAVKFIIHLWGKNSSRFEAKMNRSWFSSRDVLMFSDEASLECGSNDCSAISHTFVNSNAQEVKEGFTLPFSNLSGFGTKDVLREDKSGFGYGYFGDIRDLPEAMPDFGGSAWSTDPANGGSGLIYWDQRDTQGVITRTFWDETTELVNLVNRTEGKIKVSGVDTIANQISLGGSVSATVSEGKSNYYFITLSSNQSVNINLSTSGASDLELYLYDSTGDQVASSDIIGLADEKINYTSTTDGKYYIEVYGYEAGSYTLIVSLQLGGAGSGSVDTAGVAALALPFSLESTIANTINEGESHFYSSDLIKGQSVELLLETPEGNLELYLYDKTGKEITSSTASSESKEIVYDVSDDGIHYIEVFGREAGSYTLSLLYQIGGAGSGSLDVNGAKAVATSISLGSSLSNTVNEKKSRIYSLNLVAGQIAKVKLNVLEIKDVELYLYDTVGKEIKSAISITDSEEISYKATGDGTYFIEVFGREAGSYVLEVSAFPGGGGSGSIDVSLVTSISNSLSLGASIASTIAKGESEFYRISIIADQGVNITLSFSGINLDLYLYNQAGVQLKSSTFLLFESPEVINHVTTNSSTFFVEVHGVEGGSYTLTYSSN